MGRPKGSKNKPKTIGVATPASTQPVPQPVLTTPVSASTKRRGRPPGSKNKKAQESTPEAVVAPATSEVPQKKTKPEDSPAPQKRRGRPPKVVVPVLPQSAPTPPSPAAPVQVTRTLDVGDAPPVEKPLAPAHRAICSHTYTVEQMNHPAMDKLEKHLMSIYEYASPATKVSIEAKTLAGLTTERSILYTILAFFDIDPNTIINEKTS